MLKPASPQPTRWGGAVPDLLALTYSLLLAWFLKWEVKDLVWSLWLSSLLIGYMTILLTIFGPVVQTARKGRPAMGVIAVGGGLFMVAFFTIHFGGFHFVHSVFLNLFFPVVEAQQKGVPAAGLYWEVLRSYWPFVLGAAVSERQNLMRAVERLNPTVPYRNVVRMHLLIFFFAGAAALKLDSFVVYAVVLCVYFFPFKAIFGKRQGSDDSSFAGENGGR